MAKIFVESETRTYADALALIPLSIDVAYDDEGNVFGDCPACGERITDRGHFADTIEAISIHVDREACS
jgi:hypothetical protein